jgi:hypothetical protein
VHGHAPLLKAGKVGGIAVIITRRDVDAIGAIGAQYIAIEVYSKADTDEVDALLAASSKAGGFVLFDLQSDELIDLGDGAGRQECLPHCWRVTNFLRNCGV